jgi:radical SAM superfamily enzyme YgiQ (UPF0313 family)
VRLSWQSAKRKVTMGILLFNPYYTQLIEYYSFYRPAPPMGLLYLASYLRKHGINSKVFELGIFDAKDAIKDGKRVRFGLANDMIAGIIRDENPKIIGITSMYSVFYRDVVEITNLIKSVNPGVKIVLGGNHASSYWEYVLKNNNIDYVVIGEGEQTFLELCRLLLFSNSATHLPGIAYRKSDSAVVRTKPRELIKNLDEIPMPAFDLIDFRKYFGDGNIYSMRYPTAGIVSSRGCPGRCVFCTIKAVWGNTWRGRSPKNVVDEIEFLKKEYNVQEFAFLDDSASVDKIRWAGICDEIMRRKLDIKWTTPNGIAHWTLNEEILIKMHKAGCYRITFGIESGDEDTRKFIGKPHSLKQAKELIRQANRIGMWTICTNIIGFPYENLQSIRRTIDFAKSSGTDFACFYLLIPQPTSAVYGYFKKEGLLNFDNFFEANDFDEEIFEKINYILNEAGTDTLYFKKEELNRLQKAAYRSFIIYRGLTYLFNPVNLIRKINSSEDFRYVCKLLVNGISILSRTFNPLYKKSSDYLYAKSKVKIETIYD